ncbi:hypothetical protein CABS01_00720 [Colletotrichum abscissum]|uniref:Uncharacterized protein n=2 Tax=Colletotrichum acutatum species complex TaxID=2707335 RepID=A0A9Q8WIM6_9PEZI|nr:uncharacterized protein CLUP02_09486 [Colletotrichum lupini]XP_060312515.1 uncharacterized protein CCOS01_08079 [Colletotrichum costaricense]XP_060401179.1 uncharacterized protein CABS01_00720 [Colletotrichum abscissum]KAK1505252.1 hypothetical protein CABS01_00720 [Colletotrichum abscissum]KAK1525661.1 hypothetical protein CCOS01_08079 [Colletotrichum costaricense]UQC83990.1 hypothetical protein CLUP02_09486 [Colletotrichum lupini]
MQCRNIPLPSRANLASARHRLFKASPVQSLHYSEEKSPIDWILGLALPWPLGYRRRLRPPV